MAPATIPGRISGSVTTAKVQTRLAPSVAAASSSLESTASIASQIARTINGKAMNRRGERGSGPAEGEHDPELVGEKPAKGALPAEQDQQKIAGRHRRNDQRQMDEKVEDLPAPETGSAREGTPSPRRREGSPGSPRMPRESRGEPPSIPPLTASPSSEPYSAAVKPWRSKSGLASSEKRWV